MIGTYWDDLFQDDSIETINKNFKYCLLCHKKFQNKHCELLQHLQSLQHKELSGKDLKKLGIKGKEKQCTLCNYDYQGCGIRQYLHLTSIAHNTLVLEGRNDVKDKIENDGKDKMENDVKDKIPNNLKDTIQNDVKDELSADTTNKITDCSVADGKCDCTGTNNKIKNTDCGVESGQGDIDNKNSLALRIRSLKKQLKQLEKKDLSKNNVEVCIIFKNFLCIIIKMFVWCII